MRLIDADALMEILTTAIRNMQGVAKFIGAEDDPEIQMEIKAYTDIANGIKDMPTVEPKVAKWIYHDDDDWRFDTYHCSNCGNIITVDSKRRDDIGFTIDDMKRCNNCGAKMEEGEQDA